jgi:hypothetical protein
VLGGCLQVLYLPSLDLFSSRRLRGYTRLQKPPPFSSLLCLFGSDKAATHCLQSDVLCSRLSESLRTRPDQTRPHHTHHTRPGQATSNQPSQPYVVRSCPLFASALPASACLPLPWLLLAKPWSFRFSNPSSLAFDLPSAHWLIHSLL